MNTSPDQTALSAESGMADLNTAAAALRAHLGDFHARHRPDGVFHAEVGGPGSVPALADLDLPELHVDLLPGAPDDTQRAALLTLGYAPQGDAWTHPCGWRVVFPNHDSGWRAEQRALRALLLADPAAASQYRAAFLASGRAAADTALQGRATEQYVRTVGWNAFSFVQRHLADLRVDGAEVPWMFAAGGALDLHLGRVTRPHDDLDVVMPATAQDALRAHLQERGWRLDAAVDGQYVPWTAPLVPPHFQVHARHPELPDVLMLDLMFTDLSGDVWRYRRDPAITRSLPNIRRVETQGRPYLAPEVALLFKAGRSGQPIRDKDKADFRRVEPALGSPGRAWLRETLAGMMPGHPWLAEL